MSSILDSRADNTTLMRHLVVLAVLASALATGCSTLRGVPTRYQSTAAIVENIELTPKDLANLQAAETQSDRNKLQNKAIAVIDLQFHQFVRDLAGDRQDMSSASAGIALGAATAGAFVESVVAKTNYALLAATTIGAFGIIDRNYFYEKTIPALVAAMGAARANVLLRIRNGQQEAIDTYNGVAALADLEDYYTAGTVLAAIADVTTRAESAKQADLAEIRSIAAVSDDEIALRRSLTSAIFAIDEQSLSQGKAALATLGLAEQKSVKDTRLTLLRAMRPPTKERLKTVQDALKKSGLLP